MSEVLEQLFVTDRDVYETLMSSKQRLTLAVIQQLILDRNIFVSTSLAREDLADYLSTLPHDQNDIASLIEKSTPSARLEKSTFIELPPTVELAEIKDAIRGRAADNAAEKVIIPLTSAKTLIADFEYDELDFARNRLGQRQRKQAHVEITKTDRATIVRLPASDRARSIVDDIRKRVAQAKQGEIAAVQLSLSALALPQERTAFFTKLISSIPKHTLQTVTGVRVATFDNAGPDDELDDDVGEATTKMLAVVNKVALGGENLIATDQFQQLSAAGFFIVAITWRAIQDDQPHDLIKFAISFDDPVGGNGIKYSVRHAPSVATDRYASGFRRLSDVRESSMLRLMETAAVDALAGLTKPADSGTNG